MSIPNYNQEVITKPILEPVTTRDCRRQAYIDNDIDEEYLSLLITVAREQLEFYTSMSFIETEWRVWFHEDTIPYSNFKFRERNPYYYFDEYYLTLPRFPLQSVTSIKSYNRSDEETTVTDSQFYIQETKSITARRGRVVFDDLKNIFVNLRRLNSLEIIYKAGFQNLSDVPSQIKLAIMQQVAYLYENRQSETKMDGLSPIAIRIIAPFKTWG